MLKGHIEYVINDDSVSRALHQVFCRADIQQGIQAVIPVRVLRHGIV